MNVVVTVSVRVDGEKVAKRKVHAEVSSVEDGIAVRNEVHAAVNDLAEELRARAGA